MCPFILLYIFIRIRSAKALLPLLIGAGLVSFQLFRQFELAALGHRPIMEAIPVLLPSHLLTTVFPFLFDSPFRVEYNFFFPHLFKEVTRKLLNTELLELLYPPFVGIMTLILSFAADKKKYLVKFFGMIIIAIAAFWMLFPMLAPIVKHIPVMNKLLRLYRLGIFYTFSFAVLASFGIDRILSAEVDLKKIRTIFVSLAAFIIGILLILRLFIIVKGEWLRNFLTTYIDKSVIGSPNHLASRQFYLERVDQFFDFIRAWTNILSPSVLISLLFLILAIALISLYSRRIIKKSIFSFAISLVLLAELFVFMKVYMSHASYPDTLNPKHKVIDFLKSDKSIYRIMTMQDEIDYESQHPDRRFLIPKSNVIYGISSIESFVNLCIERYHQLTAAFMKEYDLEEGGESDSYKGNFGGAEKYGIIAGKKDNFDLDLASLMNVKYFFTYGGVEMPFPVAYEDEKFKIYLNSGCSQRAFMVYNYEVIRDKESILPRFKKIKDNFSNLIILEDEPFLDIRKTSKKIRNKVAILKYGPHSVDIKVSTARPGLLFLSDNYYPGWKAYLDNVATKIYIADYAFRAIAVPEGEHNIKFAYDPLNFKIGLGISFLFLAAVLLLCLKPVRL